MEINNLLCYVTTAINSVSIDDIVKICTAYYGISKIKEAKQTLSSIMKEEVKWRRGEDKVRGDMQDIVEMVQRCDDENGNKLPKFVADSYNALPPTSGFEIISETINQLLEEVSCLRLEVNSLKEMRIKEKENYDDTVSIKENILEIKSDIHRMSKKITSDEVKNIGSAFDFMDNKLGERRNSLQEPTFERVMESPSAPSSSQMYLDQRSPLKIGNPIDEKDEAFGYLNLQKVSFSDAVKGTAMKSNEGYKRGFWPYDNNQNTRSQDTNKYNTAHTGAISKQTQHSRHDDGFTIVENKKKHRNGGILGKKVFNEGSDFKSVKKFIDLYIGQCDLNVDCEIIKDHVTKELKIVDVNICKLNCKNPRMNSFKLSVNFADKDKVLSEDAWPEGILCRRFFASRSNINSANN